MTPITFGRDICGDLAASTSREWLVTSGTGGYASGTISGILTRRYHGLLVAATQPPVGRMLLLAKLEETAAYGRGEFPLFANRWADGSIDPAGFRYLESFRLDGTMPVWTYAIADALLEKRVWMQAGADTTYIRYDLLRASRPLGLSIKALVNNRDFHGETHGGAAFEVEPIARGAAHDIVGVRVRAHQGAPDLWLLSDRAEAEAPRGWDRDFDLSAEQERGCDGHEDHFMATEFHLTLQMGESVTIVASTDAKPGLNSQKALQDRRAYEAGILAAAGPSFEAAPEPLRHLLLAADQFIVRRATPGNRRGQTIIAGYHWFSDWGRDTMISLPGLTLTSGRPEVARNILSTFARYVSEGMLPHNFPDAGAQPEYNTADATLW